MPSSCAAIDLDDDDEDDEPAHLAVSASLRRPPKTIGVRSVFELAASVIPLRRLTLGMQANDGASVARFVQARRDVGATRCTGGQYPSDRWTPEKEEKERARRARQRPPRPPKGARTRSRKLLDLIGDD